MTWVAPIVLYVIILGVFTYLALPDGKWKIAGTLTYLMLTGIIFAGSFDLLGIPKPLFLEWRNLRGTEILGVAAKENEAVYLWVMRGDEPVTYKLPWSQGEAQDIQDKWRRMQEGSGELLFNGNGNEGGESTSERPPPPLPPKE